MAIKQCDSALITKYCLEDKKRHKAVRETKKHSILPCDQYRSLDTYFIGQERVGWGFPSTKRKEKKKREKKRKLLSRGNTTLYKQRIDEVILTQTQAERLYPSRPVLHKMPKDALHTKRDTKEWVPSREKNRRLTQTY